MPAKSYYERNKEALKLKASAWYHANKEKAKARNKAYRKTHRPLMRAADKKWRELHPEAAKVSDVLKSRRYSEKHAEEHRTKQKEYVEANRDKVSAFRRAHRQRNKEKIAAYMRDWRKRTAYVKTRRANDIEFRLIGNYRHRVWTFLKGAGKSVTTKELLGCDLPTLKAHLEQLFQPGMAWDNYGLWHVDHIQPCNDFRPITEESLRKCFHFTNLQPLWGVDNIKKGCKTNSQQTKN